VWRVCSCTPVLFSILPTKFCITVLAVVLLGTGAESRGTLKRMRGGRRAPSRPRHTDLDSRVVCRVQQVLCTNNIILCSRCFAICRTASPARPSSRLAAVGLAFDLPFLLAYRQSAVSSQSV
jgi:hypothetical protein